MKTNHLSAIVVSIGLGFLTASWTWAQPVITTQPVNQFRTPGQSAFFSVAATGAVPLTYQWLLDATAIANATNRTLFLANAQAAQGYYSVIVSNASGSVTSQVALLKVFLAGPHGFTNIQPESNGSMNLGLKGETTPLFAPYYDLYPLETSTNLVDWSPLATLQRANTALDALRFVDTNALGISQRFYRTPTNALLTPDPQPTGPYSVGTFSMLLTNTHRNNAKFMVTFWYPALAQAGVLPAIYVESPIALSVGYYDFTPIGQNFDIQAAAFFSHSLSNAPLANNLGKYPIALYDSGGGGHRRENTDKAEDLASWGYMVVGLDTSDTGVSVFPNGTVVYGQANALTAVALAADIEGRLLDLQFLLDELEILNAIDPRLAGHLDLERIGAFGWSLGGSTSAQLCLRDPRCKAGAGFDADFFETNLLTQPLNVPYLYFRSDFGPDPDPWYGLGQFDERLQVYGSLLTNAYWVRLDSTVHGNFADYDLIADSASLASFWGTPLSGRFLPPGRTSQVVRAYLLSFFNKFLRGVDDHLLDGASAAYPEVVEFFSVNRSSVPAEFPTAALVEGNDGNFYGTTQYGGTNNEGTVFRVSPAGLLTTLVSFNGTNGSHPVAGLVQASDGNFYGTTASGGTNGNNGTVYQLTPGGTLTTLSYFNGTNGSYPVAGLAQGSDGNFYGTTVSGGAAGLGTVFQMTPAGVLTTLVSFSKSTGAAPLASLMQVSDGNFYGTTSLGGNLSLNNGAGFGTAFKMTPAGVLTRLGVFTGANGSYPVAGLVQGTNVNFRSTAEYGGNLTSNAGYGFGSVFQMTTNGTLTMLASFNLTNGYNPSAALVQGSDGNFYGTTAGGGEGGGGTVFKMTPAGVLTTVVSFHGADGNSPQAPLIQGSDGNFYGTTTYGGTNGRGTVFRVTPAGVLATLVSF